MVAETPAPRQAAATPPPTPALDAYQQALAAQRPKGVAAALSTFCYATGSPAGGGPVHVYVTNVFASAPAAQYGSAFQAYLRGAHRDENIGTGMCATAPDADTAQGSRQEYLANQRKIPTHAVVEVDWRGGHEDRSHALPAASRDERRTGARPQQPGRLRRLRDRVHGYGQRARVVLADDVTAESSRAVPCDFTRALLRPIVR